VPAAVVDGEHERPPVVGPRPRDNVH
jgi:hypothetical protein